MADTFPQRPCCVSDDDVTLPAILRQLYRLEHKEPSYDEVLHDFASRRRVNSIREGPVHYVADSAERTDELVQAFLSLSHGRFSVGSGKHLPLTPHGSMGVKQIRRAPQNLERLGQSAWKFGLSNCIAGAPICPINSDGDGDATTRDVGSPKHAARSCLKEKHAELVPTENRKKRARQVMGSEGLQSRHANPVDDPTFDFEGKKTLKALRRGRHSNLRSRLRCSVSGSTAKGLLDYYPSRPNSPEEPVSLMSPRMWKKIRRLPAPGEVERDTLQRVERAAMTFSADKLKLGTSGGLYSIIGRNEIGLTEADIERLTATCSGQAGVLAAAEHAAVLQGLTRHGTGALATLLGAGKAVLLPTADPPCYHRVSAPKTADSGSVLHSSKPASVVTRPSSSRPSNRREGKNNGQQDSEYGSPLHEMTEPVQGLETSERMRVLGAEDKEHLDRVQCNLRRLRVLMGKSPQRDGGVSDSPVFTVAELRTLEGAKSHQRDTDKWMPPDGEDVLATRGRESWVTKTTGGRGRLAAELSSEGSHMLRSLGVALLSSIQSRIRREFRLLAFRKWRAVIADVQFKIYLDATILIQSCMRRNLARTEACLRRRLATEQASREKEVIESMVRRRQEAALHLQRWMRGGRGRRRVKDMRLLLRAASMVQRAARARADRGLARERRREELRRIEEAVRTQRQEEEILAQTRVAIMKGVEELERQEDLSRQRNHTLNQAFRREGAAIRIQSVWRARALKRNLGVYVRIGKRTRAMRIQRAVRCFLARRELQRRKKRFEKKYASDIAASIIVQGLVRRRIAWKKVDARRFDRNKEQLVSTLEAERALRDRKRRVPRLKAVTAREGIISARAKGEPYIVDIVALKILIADKRRALNPWQETMDNRAATKIQAVWRGYRQVVRVRRMRVHQRREQKDRNLELRLRAATNFQRVFRGRRARVEAKARRYGLRAVRIQKVWRGFLGKRVAMDRRQQIQAATLLQRRLRGAQARSLAARLRLEAVTTSAPAIKIQASARRHLAKRRRRKLVIERQIEWEWRTMAGEMARFCAARAMLRVIVDGAMAASCKGDGVTQFIFRKLAVKRGADNNLASYRLEGRAFAKLLTGTPGLLRPSFNATDVDLIFAKVKDKEEKTLSYVQYVSALNIIAATLFPELKRFRDFHAFKPKAARLLELVDGKILNADSATEYRQFAKKAGERYLDRSAGKIQSVARGRLGRNSFSRARMQKEREARASLEVIAVVKLQALARMYCARFCAIRIAQARIAKYIDPTSLLRYWVNPKTGITSWTKPKILGAEDVEHAMMVATSKTEHLVKCSICDERPVKRVCHSCRDSYCFECFDALHGKGCRRKHVAPTVHICCSCNYQHGSRLCETCTFKKSSTCAYCDVCFFNRHPGLDPLLAADVGGAKSWTLPTANMRMGWDHRWTALVVTCVECRRHAARWLCDHCQEVYCVGCYASVHQHGTKVMHPAEKLPYYPVNFHMEYAMNCRKRSRTKRDEDALALELKEQAQQRERAATTIQSRWRGRVGGIEGRAYLKAGRMKQREAWRQRKRDDRARKAVWYSALDLAGVAPRLKSDTIEEKVLKRIRRTARTRPRKYIKLNREDDAWVAGKLDSRKGIVKRGFHVGEVEDLKDQAKRGGVRLPGRHSMKTGHRAVFTDPTYDMSGLIKPRNVVRIEGELFLVEAVLCDRLRVDRVWTKPDTEGLLLYKMVLSSRQKLHMGVSNAFWKSEGVQYGIQIVLVLEEDIINRLLRKAAMHYKRNRHKHLYGLAKATLKRHEERIRSLKLRLNTAQGTLDDRPTTAETDDVVANSGVKSLEVVHDAPLGWTELFDDETGRYVWKNVATGEVCQILTSAMKEQMRMADDLAKQKESLRAKRAARKR